MALKFPYLPPNPLYLRAFGGKNRPEVAGVERRQLACPRGRSESERNEDRRSEEKSTVKAEGLKREIPSNSANYTVGRCEMHLAVSEDGLTFTRLARLNLPSPKATTFQYPHAIEYDGHLLIAYSNKKNFTELIKLRKAAP